MSRQPRPKRDGVWEDFSGSSVEGAPRHGRPGRRGHNPTSGDIHRVHLLTAFVFLGGLLMLFDAIGVFSPVPLPVQPGEIDLSGTWRIRFEDSPAFAAPDLRDGDWCTISAPDPRVPAAEPAPQARGCPAEVYPVARMRQAAYWYRRAMVIETQPGWREPALFLGLVETRARVYWDGEYLGSARKEQVPVTLPLAHDQLLPGRHLLALRVESGDVERPGIYHGYARGLALGELSNSLPSGMDATRTALVVAMLAALLQVVVFALLVFLTIQSRGARWDLSWLSLYFGSMLIHAIRPLTADPLAWYLRDLALAGWSTSLVGLGLDWYPWADRVRHVLGRFCALLWVILALGYTYAFELDSLGQPQVRLVTLGVATLPLAVYALSAAWWLVLGSVPEAHRGRPAQAKLATLLLVLMLYGLNVVSLYSLIRLPRIMHSPLFVPMLSCLVFYFAVEAYADALRSLAFYGRFIRPGLKRLLREHSQALYADRKLFRARKTVVMKIDVANYTRTCFEMPYGVRRLFMDLWYTVIDQVVAEKVFFDKSLGDGSVYCFDEGMSQGQCSTALDAALEIRDSKLRQFDELFLARLALLLETTPELERPMAAFERRYRERVGEGFRQRRTLVRIALASGYVDEGLWGLQSQSHYDVQGGALVLAARIEAAAHNGEILFDNDFFAELCQEQPEPLDLSRIEARHTDLKGVGPTILYALPLGQNGGWRR